MSIDRILYTAIATTTSGREGSATSANSALDVTLLIAD